MAMLWHIARPVILLVAAAAGSVAHAATVAAFDGSTVSGEQPVFATGTVALGGKTIALADCDWIEPGGTVPGPGRTAVWIALADGGCVPAGKISAANAPDAVLLEDGPLGPLQLPLTAVIGWGERLAGDVAKDRVALESGTIAGSVLGIADGMLRFQSPLDPKPLSLPLAKVQSLAMATAVRAPKGIVLAAAFDGDHPPLLVLPKDGLPLTFAPIATGQALAGRRLRVEGGRRTYLGALKPAQVEEAGAFGVVWKHRIDANLDGGPLILGGTRYVHGVTVHSKARLAWDLGGSYERLRAIAGISDLVAPEGDCQASLIGDGTVLWTRESVKGSDKPTPIDVDVHGIRSLELRVEYGARYDIGDHFTLADAWLLKAK
jgi:hypothetical protein